MHVLLTGPFGNIGSHTTAELLRQGHQVRAFDLRTPRTEKVAQRFDHQFEVRWGDIRNVDEVRAAVEGVDAIVHLAAMIPPVSVEQPALAEQVNVGGTRNLIEAAQAQATPPKFFFASSFDLFGHTQDQPPPRRATDPVQATDDYSAHKIAGEALVKQSGLEWVIERFCDIPDVKEPHPIMFEIPLDQRFEVIHGDDIALAIANTLKTPEVWGQTVLIGGGATCQIRYRDYLFGMLEAIGIGPLPEEAFTRQVYCTDWLDSEYSQQRLQYQRHSFQEVVDDIAREVGWKRYLAGLTRPIVRRTILKMSPYWQAQPGK
jgi:nucleoside-diphosphate-sugar epimerase